MKNIFILSLGLLCCFFGGSAFANCTSVNSWKTGVSNTPSDNEYLYPNKATYDKMVSQGTRFSGGWFYECGRGCSNGSYVYMGSGHVFKGSTKNYPVLYLCNTNLGSSFEARGVKDCYTEWNQKGTPPSGWKQQTVHNANGRGTFYKNVNFGTVCVLEPEIANCLKDTHAYWNGKVCQCGSVDGVQYTWNTKQKKCIANTPVQTPVPKNEKEPIHKDPAPKQPAPKKPRNPSTPAEKSCVEKRKCSSNPNATECAACCMVDAAVAVWNAETNKCNCVDATKKFDVASGTCLVATLKKTCPEAVILQLAQWKKQCVDNSAIIEAINSLETYCSNPNPEENNTTYNVLYKLITDLHPENCGVAEKAPKKDDYTKEREASREKIADIRNKLNQLKAGLGTSVWKDREGNFNTARLASDSIAGVVLGTAGGLITSNVIKKNQIKGGFEDINCAIGGQTVAGFGDEFQVGIR